MRAKNRQDRTDRFLRARLGLMLAARGASDAAAHNLIVAVGTSFPVAAGALSTGHDTSCWRHSEARAFSATTLSFDGSNDELPPDCGQQISALVEAVESAIMTVAAKAQLGALFLAAASRADPVASGARQSALMAVAERQLRHATRSYDNIMNSTLVRWAFVGEPTAPVAALDTLRQFVVSSVSHDVPAELARRAFFFVGMLRATAARLPLAYGSHRGRPVDQRELVAPFDPPTVCVATNVSWRVRHHAAGLFYTWRPSQVPGLASHLAVRVPRCPRQHRAPILAVHFLQRFLGWAQVHVDVAMDHHRAQPMLEHQFVGAHIGEQVRSIVSALPRSVASAPSVQLTRLQAHALVDMVSSDSNDQASRGADPTCFDAHIQLGNLFDWASHSDRCGTGMWLPARCPTRANDGRPHPACEEATGRIPCHRWHRAALRSEAVLPTVGVYDHAGTARMPVVHHDAVVNDTMNPCPTAMTVLDYVAIRHYVAAVQIRPDSRAALLLLDAALRRRSASTTVEVSAVRLRWFPSMLTLHLPTGVAGVPRGVCYWACPQRVSATCSFLRKLRATWWTTVAFGDETRQTAPPVCFPGGAVPVPTQFRAAASYAIRNNATAATKSRAVLRPRRQERCLPPSAIRIYRCTQPVRAPIGVHIAPLATRIKVSMCCVLGQRQASPFYGQVPRRRSCTAQRIRLGGRNDSWCVQLHHACGRALTWDVLARAGVAATTFVVGSTQMLLLLPGAHVLPDVAETNLGVRVHVPLSVGAHVAFPSLSRPARGCGNRPQHGYLRVGDRVRRWAQGKPLAFDPSFEHEMVNCGEHPVLLLVLVCPPAATNLRVPRLTLHVAVCRMCGSPC